MEIRTTFHGSTDWRGSPRFQFWSAVDADTDDFAGWGATEAEAIADLKMLMEE